MRRAGAMVKKKARGGGNAREGRGWGEVSRERWDLRERELERREDAERGVTREIGREKEERERERKGPERDRAESAAQGGAQGSDREGRVGAEPKRRGAEPGRGRVAW